MQFQNPAQILPELRAFEEGKVSLLVASETVSRGLDLPNVDAVFILDAIFTPNSYLRILSMCKL